jgi:hypothetical protein
MSKLLSIVTTTAVVLSGAGAMAAELPTYEVSGFPITPHQLVAVNSAQVQEQYIEAIGNRALVMEEHLPKD